MNRTKRNASKMIPILGAVLSAGLTFVLSTVAAGQTQPAAKQTPPAKATFIGSETCAGCHEDQANWLKGSVHDEAVTAKSYERGGCESCHGPGSIHAENPSKENILTFSTESPDRRSNACLSCHAKKPGLRDFHRTKHRINRVSCDQCHAGRTSQAFHSMRTLQDSGIGLGAALCESCHSEKRADFSMPFRHRVEEGLVACVDCHGEHTGFETGRRRTEQRNLTCVRCHSELRGPFVFPHMPVRVGGCTTCHAPHGSTNPRLLVRSDMRTLCLECHTNTPRTHDLSQPRFQNCSVCHRAVHGSNSSRMLFD